MKNNKCELLAPAGNYAIFEAVLAAGADAVYAGGEKFGARAYADNFTDADVLRAIDYAHLHGKKFYLTVNTMLKKDEFEHELYAYLLPFYRAGLDAVIVQDFGVFQFLHRNLPELALHASTQMTISGVESARLMKEAGASRVVTSRELSCEEIAAIRDQVDIEIESFVHGALCYCYSGQCLMSSMLGGRSGNRGRCAQPCRLPYTVLDEKKQLFGKKETFVLSPKDLCTIEILPQILECGVNSLKIEGRMKQLEYAAGVVSVYRKYLDLYEQNPKQEYRVSKADQKRLMDTGNRSGFTKGYYVQHNGPEMMSMENSSHAKSNSDILEQVHETYAGMKLQEPVAGFLSLKKDHPAELTVTAEDVKSDRMFFVQVTGDVVQTAQKRPLSEETVREKIGKAGNTPYRFQSLELDMDADIFLPVQGLNQLRREALEQLEAQQLAVFRRESEQTAHFLQEGATDAGQKDFAQTPLYVSLETFEGWEIIQNATYVAGVYLDSTLWKREHLLEGLCSAVKCFQESGKTVFFQFPQVFRKDSSDFYEQIWPQLQQIPLDGFVIRSLDALAFCIRKGVSPQKRILDHTLYAYSPETQRAYLKLGAARICAPFELNRRELKEYPCAQAEYVLYGYQTLMVSAQCVHKNTSGCDKKRCQLYLRDRYGKEFLVKNNCNDCYNTIYNSTPLCLFSQMEEIDRFGFASYRLQFTQETEEQIRNILKLYQKAVIQKQPVDLKFYMKDYTNGHYKRGVE
ncbi:MAG: U32 family peptidase [Lachnospiraceae bacterium]